MWNQDPRAFPDPEDGGGKVEGFGKPEGTRRSKSRRDPSAVPPVDPVPDAGVAKPDGGERKRRK